MKRSKYHIHDKDSEGRIHDKDCKPFLRPDEVFGTMPKITPEWEDTYDKMFGELHHKVCEGKICNCHIKVKAFIPSLLSQTHKEARKKEDERIIKMLEKMKLPDGYIQYTQNELLDTIISTLSPKEVQHVEFICGCGVGHKLDISDNVIISDTLALSTSEEEVLAEFPLGKENYCPQCYFSDDKVILRTECPHNNLLEKGV